MKPVPKEMTITCYEPTRNLMIYTSTVQAEEWVAKEAPAFGKTVDCRTFLGYWSLHVSPLYDLMEVKAYLESYLDQDFVQQIEERLNKDEFDSNT